MTKDQIDEILGNTRDVFADEVLERAGSMTPNTGNCPEVSMPTHREQDTAC